MNHHSLVAMRYATALFNDAMARQTLETTIADVRALQTLFKESRDFTLFTRNPVIKAEQKATVLKSIADKAQISPNTTTFLLLLTQKHRAPELANILSAFETLYNTQHGIIPLEVTSALELDAAQKEALLRSLEARIGKKPYATYRIDPALIGGFTVQIGDTMIDSSVRHQLAALKKSLLESRLN